MKKIFIYNLLFLLLLGCGGGSSGTGSSETQLVRGVLLDDRGMPIANAKVEILGTDLFLTTNENGEFSFIRQNVKEEVILEIENEEQLTIAPDVDDELSIEVVIQDQNICAVSVEGEEIRDDCIEKRNICSASANNCADNEYCDYLDGSCGTGEGICKPYAEVCPELYSPVCGCDGKTYGNSCEAQGVGVSIAQNLECAIENDS